jgi:serine/threonine protein kinase/Flp pilus assembly protein TadD
VLLGSVLVDNVSTTMTQEDSMFGVEPDDLKRLVMFGLEPDDTSAQEDKSPPTAAVDELLERPGARIGQYKLLRVLGEGGMGIVYLAQQDKPVVREVALKLIKPGMDSKRVMARFEAEEQALAMMEHPHVARVYNAGLTGSGRPYFVMEYVKGVSITEHCDREKLGIEARLGLFLQVCEAVQHAHQKGIIHRDIKPSNIQVAIHGEKALPKIIDFGVAKALSQLLTERTLVTEQGQMVGTPEYMSPEQAEMTNQDIDTRTDIYSLGVVLYELLSGTLPFDSDTLREGGADHMRKMIREKDPKTPSTRLSAISGDESQKLAQLRRTDPRSLTRRLHGDLDWITIKAMDKDRMRRYQSAHALAEDIQRHLNHEPVLARRPGPIYRMRKFLRRNRTAVLASVAALILIVAMVGVSVMYVKGLRRTRALQTIEHRNVLTSALELRSRGQFQDALDKIKDILSSKHVGPEAQLLHARLILELEGPTEAVKELQLLLTAPDELACQAHFLLARIYLENAPRDPQISEEYSRRAKEHQQQGERLFSESAEACFNRSMMAGTVNKTLEWLNRALELNPGHYDSLEARALAYYAIKDYDRMEIDASVMTGNRPNDSQGYALRAIARRKKAIRKDEEGLFADALHDHNGAIQLEGEQAELYDQRRRTHMQMGNFEAALADARACVRLQSDEGIHHFDVFCALVALGRYDEAKARYEWTIDSGLMDKSRFDMSAAKYVSDTLDAGLPWHPASSSAQGPAFLAMHESAEVYQELAQKARRVVPEGFRSTWSPDGTELAYSSGILGFSGIEILNLQTDKTRLLTVPGLDPAWSPDGRYIAFNRTRKPLHLADVAARHEAEYVPGAWREIWLIKSDGSEDPRFLAHGMMPSWSRDPSRVYYTSSRDWKFYSVSIHAGTKPVRIVGNRGAYPIVSPDGRHAAIRRAANRSLGILDLATESFVAEIASVPVAHGSWSPNGQELGVGGRSEAGFWICELDPSMQVTKASKVLRGSFGSSSWSGDDTGRLAINRRYTNLYHEIWVADLDPNLSAAEALGPGQTLEEHYQELIGLYTRRIEIDPENPEHYLSLSRVYGDLGDKDKARESLDRIKERAKDSSRAAAAYGQLGFPRIKKNPPLAMEQYRRAHELDPGNWYYLWGLGATHASTGQLDQAIAKYTESTKLPGGENSLNYFYLAMAYKWKRQRDEAVGWYEKAMEQMPADKASMDASLLQVLDAVHSQASSQLGIKTQEETL